MAADQTRVLVLGYGEMGHAMQCLLADRVQLDIWEKFPEAGFQSVDIDQAAPLADIVIFCLPANPHREVIERIAPLITPDCICLSIAKGLDESGETAAQIFADVLPKQQPYALLYGPMISEEIRLVRYAFAQLGCQQNATYQRVSKLFKGTRLYVVYSADIIGISWSVILKNVYAMVFGMADELQLGDNMRGYLAVAAVRELDQIVRQMGGQGASSFHLAGLGDLITTATSEDSHHHELGRKLARSEREGISGEGIHTLAMVRKYQLFTVEHYPLFHLIHTIIQNPDNILQQIDDYLDQVFTET